MTDVSDMAAVSIQSFINLGETRNARMNERTGLNLGDVVYILITFRIPAS